MEREQQSLSLNTPLCEGNGVGLYEERNQERGISKKEILEEVKRQLWLAGPLISVSLLQYCIQMISVMFVGHLGELSLSGASMATSFASVTGFSLLVSLHLFLFISPFFFVLSKCLQIIPGTVTLLLELFDQLI
jgi:MATE family multidrug resistance protein